MLNNTNSCTYLFKNWCSTCCCGINDFFRKCIINHTPASASVELTFYIIDKEIRNIINENAAYKAAFNKQDIKWIKTYIAIHLANIKTYKIHSKFKEDTKSIIENAYEKKLVLLAAVAEEEKMLAEET